MMMTKKLRRPISPQQKPIRETTIMSEKGPVRLSLFEHSGEKVIMYSAPNISDDELVKFKREHAEEITKFKLEP